ncbi:hypothetical protein EYD10_00056 [Varanus komodoensis]|nr:hypothetical protein EYD10_00056 [Varanus komodoensis]
MSTRTPLPTVNERDTENASSDLSLDFTEEYIMQKAGLDESQVGIKNARRNNNNLRYADDSTLMAESEEKLKSLLMQVKEESAKVGLETQYQENEDHGIQSSHFLANRWGRNGVGITKFEEQDYYMEKFTKVYRAVTKTLSCYKAIYDEKKKMAVPTTLEAYFKKATAVLNPVWEVSRAPSGPSLLDEFQLLRPDDVDKVLGMVRPTTCLLDPCQSWLLKEASYGIGPWVREVVNTSLREGRVPFPLKEAVIQPILKKASLDPELAASFRLVANTPFLGKVLERLVAGQLHFLDEMDYLDPFQSSFRPGYGTEFALVALYDDLCRERDKGSASLLLLLDLSAAFDTINHRILLERLAGLGVGGSAWQWFYSYLTGRLQKVVLGDCSSAPWQLCHGVPQGSVLSPLLFNIDMKPLGEVIRRFELWCHQYADDTQLYLSFTSTPGEVVAVLSQCLTEVMGWMRASKLSLDPDKTEVLLMNGSRFQVSDFDLVLDGVALPLKDRVHSLGVLLDPEMSLESQVAAVARSAFLQLRLIHQLHPYLDKHCLATVIHALVTSWLDYCKALHVGWPLKTVWILQLVQKRAARLLPGTGLYSHITPVLYQLHWLPEVWAQFKVLVLTYKALNGLGPGYLKEGLSPYMPSRPLISAGEALLQEPSLKEIKRTSTRSRGFSVVAPRLWNVLPGEVRLVLSLYSF